MRSQTARRVATDIIVGAVGSPGIERHVLELAQVRPKDWDVAAIRDDPEGRSGNGTVYLDRNSHLYDRAPDGP